MCQYTSELNAIRRRRHISRKTVDYEPKNYNEVQIRLFGEMKIIGKDLTLPKSEIAEPIRFLIAYLAMNPGKAICPEQLNECMVKRFVHGRILYINLGQSGKHLDLWMVKKIS